jgi:hypothetical protein
LSVLFLIKLLLKSWFCHCARKRSKCNKANIFFIFYIFNKVKQTN